MWYVLDTSLLLGGKEPPAGRWATTPEAEAEVKPGGKDASRYAMWQANGLVIRSAGERHLDAVDEAGIRAGNLGRLSPADRSLLALALELEATLVTDDFTVLDLASRLDIRTQTVNQDAPQGTIDWGLRCVGCGRWYDEAPPRDECLICGSPVKTKRRD